MRACFRSGVKFLLGLGIVLVTNPLSAWADDQLGGYVPEQLRPWVQWVIESSPERQCSVVRDQATCTWPGRLNLTANQNGAEFHFTAALDTRSFLTIPGDSDTWPVEVKISSGTQSISAPIIERVGRPAVFLERGVYEVSGRFLWSAVPEKIRVPANTGLIQLEVNGETMKSPKLGGKDELWLRKVASKEESEEDRVKFGIFRKLVDGAPFEVLTNLEMRISGKARPIEIGNIMQPGFVPVQVESELSYQLSPDYKLTVQGKPGVYHLTIHGVLNAAPKELAPTPLAIEGWPGEEIWVWESDEALRSVELSGASQIETERTNIPGEWAGLPAYVVQPETKLTFEEMRRGEQQALPNQLDLKRELWLDLAGHGFTVRDSLSGAMNEGWRLNVQSASDKQADKQEGALQLGRVQVSGEPQLITKDISNGKSGIETRSQNIQVAADSRIEGSVRDLLAVGWDHDVNSLSINLNLPPGWKVFAATGVDNISHSWLTSWTLFDFFFLIMMCVATYKLIGKQAGIVAVVALLLCHGEGDAPYISWFFLLGCVALLRVLPDGGMKKLVNFVYGLTVIILLLLLIPFAAFQIRNGLYPQLGYSGYMADFGSAIQGMTGSVSYQEPVRDYDMLESAPQSAPAPASKSEMGLRRKAMSSAGVYGGAGEEGEQTNVAELSRQLQQVDPNAVVHTGPGVPDWHWQSWTLYWSGPVGKDQRFGLWLLSPGTNLFLGVLRVVLLLALFVLFVGRERINKRLFGGGLTGSKQTLAGVVLLLTVLVPRAGVAQDTFPGEKLLKELETRVVANQCKTDCVKASAVRVSVQGVKMAISAVVHSRGSAGWAIPGPVDQFEPSSVTVDGSAVSVFRRDDAGLIWVRLGNGVHQVTVEGELLRKNTATLQFGIDPGFVSVDAAEWNVDGVSPTGGVKSSIQLTRKAAALKAAETKLNGAAEAETEVILPNWYIVNREFSIAIPWSVTTTITRIGSTERPALVRVPLLMGEAIDSQSFKVEKGEVLVSFPRAVGTLTYTSTLKEEPVLNLTASDKFTENWTLNCSSIFRCNYSSELSPTRTTQGGQNTVEWNPWPGEKLELQIGKPQGVEGAAYTVQGANLDFRPGPRIMEATLRLTVRSSRDGFLNVSLPEGVELQAVKVNDEIKTARFEKGELFFPLSPAELRFEVSWKSEAEFGAFARMPEVKIKGDAVNVRVALQLPPKRWILFTGGPSWGPAVLFWGELIVVLIFSYILGKSGIAPLGVKEWCFLGIGLATVDTSSIVLAVLWLFALSQKKKRLDVGRWKFNFYQLLLIVLTFIALSVLYSAIHHGLILSPDMQVSGNNSTNTSLNWYVDRVSGSFPTPWVLTLPIWTYRVLMLIWSTWLAFALMRWLKWGWECFSEGGVWRKKEKVVKA